MAHHDLKANTESFELLILRKSQVQLRLNDRNFKTGDTCLFREWVETYADGCLAGAYTGRKTVTLPVLHVLDVHPGLTPGWCLVVLAVPEACNYGFDSALAGKTTLEAAERAAERAGMRETYETGAL